jgi:hypothetical protein
MAKWRFMQVGGGSSAGAATIDYADTATIYLDISITSADIAQFIDPGFTNTVADDFNRANAGLGSNWEWVYTAHNISSNAVIPGGYGSDAFERYVGSFAPDQFAEVTVTSLSAAGSAQSGSGVILRCGPGNGVLGDGTIRSAYRIVVNGRATGNLNIGKFVAGTFTELLSTTITFVNGDRLRAEIRGSTITVFANGLQVAQTTDASLTSGNPGIGYSSTATGQIVDDFAGGSATVIYVDIQPSGTELREVTDAATVLVDLQASGTEYRTQEFVDSATALVDLQASGTELREVTDALEVYVDLQASGTELREVTDALSVYFDLQASGTDVYIPPAAAAILPRPPIIVGGQAFQDRSRW